MAGVARVAVIIGMAIAALGCGDETTLDATTSSTEPVAMLPECPPQMFAPTVAVTDGVPPQFPVQPDPQLLGVLETYGRDHPEAWAGLWLTPNDDRNDVTVAIVGDVDMHREAILARRPTPSDVALIHPPPTNTVDTLVAESGFEIVVVPADLTLAELDSLGQHFHDRLTGGQVPVDVNSYGTDVANNVIRIGISEVNETNRVALAQVIDADAACVEQMGPFRFDD